jgi:hypothetical protein
MIDMRIQKVYNNMPVHNSSTQIPHSRQAGTQKYVKNILELRNVAGIRWSFGSVYIIYERTILWYFNDISNIFFIQYMLYEKKFCDMQNT